MHEYGAESLHQDSGGRVFQKAYLSSGAGDGGGGAGAGLVGSAGDGAVDPPASPQPAVVTAATSAAAAPGRRRAAGLVPSGAEVSGRLRNALANIDTV